MSNYSFKGFFHLTNSASVQNFDLKENLKLRGFNQIGTVSPALKFNIKTLCNPQFLPLAEPFSPEHSIFHTAESGRHSDRFVVRNSFSLCENKNKLAGAMLRISDMWFPV